MKHKWGKEYKTDDCVMLVWRQQCEVCGYVRGVAYRRKSATPKYFVVNGTYLERIPDCKKQEVK